MSVVGTSVPAGTRIWVAAGRTDMRKGFTGLCSLVQGALENNPFAGTCSSFVDGAGILSSSCGGMERDFVYWQNDWNVVASSGRKRKTVRCL